MDKSFFNCPHCSTQFEIQPGWAGMQVSCPICRKSFVIPENVAATAPVMPNIPPPSTPGTAPAMPNIPPPSTPGTAPVMQNQPTPSQLGNPVPVMQNQPTPSQLGNPVPVMPNQPTTTEAGKPSSGTPFPRNRPKLTIRKNNPEPVPGPTVQPVQQSSGAVPVLQPAEPMAEQPPVLPPQSAHKENKKAKKAETEEKKKLFWVKPLLKFIMLLGLIAAGYYLYLVITTPTLKSLAGNQLYAMTQKRANPGGTAGGLQDIIRHDFFPFADSKTHFFYRTAQFSNINLHKKGEELFEGTIYFTRGSMKLQSRPISINRQGRFTHYRFPFKYADNPEYLFQDADLIFSLAVQIDKNLQGWKFVSAHVAEKNTLVCIMTKDGKRKRIRLKAEQVPCDDNIGRIWVEILRKKK